MNRAVLLLAIPLALAACKAHSDKESSVTISTSDDGKTTTTTTKTTASSDANSASTDSSVELKLPGGFEARIKAPNMLSGMTHIDIDGVGLYPGANINSMNVNASAASDDNDRKHDATVLIGFTAKDAPATVASWYATQFAAKGHAITRSGDTISGKTEDDNDFTIAMTPGDGGGTKGLVTIKSS